MNSKEEKAKDLELRERELQQRERELRLREIESEIYQQEPQVHQTQKHQKPEGQLNKWGRKLARFGKFLAVVIAVVITIRIAYWLALVMMVGGIAWLGYEIFWKDDK